MFKFNNEDTKTTSMTSFDDFIFNFEYYSHLFLVFVLFTLNR